MKHEVSGGSGILRSRRLGAILAIVAVLVAGTIIGQAEAQSASAASYPSWQDVLNSRSSEKAKQTEITRLEGLLAQLEAAVVAADAVAVEKGQIYFDAQQEYDKAAYKAQQLQAKADEAMATAEESKRQAGQIAARLQRARGTDLTSTLLFSDAASDGLLTQMGMASKVSQQSAGIFAKAVREQNSAQKLTDQADVAKVALEELAAIAQQAMVEAQAAADQATAALEEQNGNKARLQAQLASLVENRIATEAEYSVGKAIADAAAAAAAAAAKAAADAAAAAGGGGGGAGGAVSPSGWARPSAGGVVSSYGWRVPPKNGASTLHAGVDLGAGCSYPIYAAQSGTVSYAGVNGGYGNYISINHGGGVSTAYGHIINGGIQVRSGQQVSAGQQIALVGSTGTSTGCHLHFEVRVGGSTTDPVLYMRERGVSL